MRIYAVRVISENGLKYIYSVFAHDRSQAENLAKRYHNSCTIQPGYRAAYVKVVSSRQIKPGVIENGYI